MVDLGEFDARRFTPHSEPDVELKRISDAHRERVMALLQEMADEENWEASNNG